MTSSGPDTSLYQGSSENSTTEIPGADGAPAADGDDLFHKLKEWHKEAADHLAEWRERAREDFAFVAGDQWTEEDMAMLKEQLRPVVTFNRVQPVIDVVSGMEVNNRQEVKYLPRMVQQSGENDLLTNAAKFFRDESEAEDEESDAFYDTVVCGLGATETRPDFDEDPEGLIPVDRLEPLTVWYDPSARKRNLVDSRYRGYDRTMSLEEAKALFPTDEAGDPIPEEDLDAGWARAPEVDGQSPHNNWPQVWYKQGVQQGNASGRQKITIVYVEWWDKEPYTLAIDPFTAQKIEIAEDQAVLAKQRLATFGIKFETVTLQRKVFKSAFLGNRVLKTGPGRCPHDFTVNFITGKRDRNSNTWYGLVRAMKDPQRWANKFFSQILHIINSNAKGGVLVEKGAFDNPRKAEQDWARSDAMIFVKDGALEKGKVQPRAAITFPAGLDQMMEYAAASIRDTTGINVEMQGLADRNQPGVLEYQRRQAGMTILAGLFDSLRRYRKEQGRAMLHIMQEYIPAGRLIRIDSDNGPQYAQLVKNPEITKYDVIVDEAPSSPNQKETVWGMLTQMMPFLQKQPVPGQVWAELLKYSPLPDSLSVKLGQYISQSPQVPPQAQEQMKQMADQMKQLQQQLQQSEMEKAKLKIAASAKDQQTAAEMRLSAAKMAHEQMLAEQELAMKQQIADLELRIQQARMASEMQIKDVEAAHRIRQTDANIALTHAKIVAEAKLNQEKFDRAHELDRAETGLPPLKKGLKKRVIRARKNADGEIIGGDIHEDGDHIATVEIGS